MLFDYMKQVQRFLRDGKTELVDPYDIIVYVNRARREIALRTQCVRVLTPISGTIVSASIVAHGANYTAPTVTISAPDFPSGMLPLPNGLQATATASEAGGTISGVTITQAGAGYFQPQITITDPTGAGASITANLSFLNLLQGGQEVYPFSGVSLAAFPGVKEIIQVKSVSIVYANYRYSLPIYSFSVYQAMIRQYPFQYEYVPTVGAQFGQGSAGTFFLYPIASQQYQMEWDCICTPSDLVLDPDVEAIPDPWTLAVPYFAAHLAFLELQNANAARMYYELFEKQLNVYSVAARSGRVSNPYGRW